LFIPSNSTVFTKLPVPIEYEKVGIKPLDEKGNYRLWRIRVAAACDAKDLYEAVVNEKNPYDEKDIDKQERFEAS